MAKKKARQDTSTRKKARKSARRAKTSKKKLTRKAARSKKPSVRKSKVAKAAAKPAMEGTCVGEVTHYFPHVNAAALKIKKGELKTGDLLYFKGHTTDFKQTIESMQIDHVPVQQAGRGAEVGIQVKERARQGDKVYKL